MNDRPPETDGQHQPELFAPEYERLVPDRRTPLIDGGEVLGVFVNAAMAAQSRRMVESALQARKDGAR